jgi:arylsulfatase A-like enzyme
MVCFLRHLRDLTSPFLNTTDVAWHMLLTCPTILALCVFIQHAVPARRLPAFLVNTTFLCLNALLCLFHNRHKAVMDYTIIVQYLSQALQPGPQLVILHAFPWPARLGLLAFVVGLLGVEVMTQHLSRPVRLRRRALTLWTSGSVYGCLCLGFPLIPQDQFSPILRAAYHYHLERFNWQEAPDTPRFPYVQRGRGIPRPSGEWPHIFMVCMESFNARFVQRVTPAGAPITPVFNTLIPQGIYVHKFYGNSIQTVRGQFALLSSVLPSFRGKEATDYPHLRLKALPQILHAHGYTTIYSQAYPDLSFDQVMHFMPRLGFAHLVPMSASDVDHPAMWGWGLRDDVFFARFFDALDRMQAQPAAAPGTAGRFFSVLHTASHHFPFNQMPAEPQDVYPQPRTPEETFSNSLHRADRYLQEFFAQLRRRAYLKNSLIILVGDHSFPAGEHGLYYNEIAYYEEFFRTPLLMLWEGHLTPRVIEAHAFSQLDVAPTILELLGITDTHHFLGRSIFQLDTALPVPIHLVQPYNGTYLGTVLYPWKYVQHLATKREFLYDLNADPLEEYNLAHQPAHAALRQRLRAAQEGIFLNQKLLEENRIWPPVDLDVSIK